MNALVEKIVKNNIASIFTTNDLINAGLNNAYIEDMLQEAIIRCDIIHIKNDIYTLSKPLRKELIMEEVLAQKLVPDSYVSMEFVLSRASWIPENVYVITCVTNGKSINIDTKFGYYEYAFIPQKVYAAGVRRITNGINQYKKATPLKALADIICKRGYNWTALEPLQKSFRIEYYDLETLTAKDFEELHETYGVPNVEKFLCGIRKELAL